jgi:diguanylate cyclase
VAKIARADQAGSSARHLYDQIGAFLFAQRLDPDPANFAFAYAILANPDGPLAKAVAALTDGGVRLTLRDIETLGCDVSTDAPNARARADGLVAKTQLQVEGFADMVAGLRTETQHFSRDLEASASAIERSRRQLSQESAIVDEVARITTAMVERVHVAEAQLEAATREAEDLRQKLDEARDNARRDPLTDLPNRRAFEEEFAARQADATPMVLAVCDVDHFKSVNDRFGHAVGDRVLKAIGEALKETCGDHLVARYGGEEFVVLFSGIDAGVARGTLEAARELVAGKRYRLRESDQPLGAVTLSGGLTPVVQSEAAGTAFHRADALLYSAKKDGRNCIRVG